MVVQGHPDYYPRFGFVRGRTIGDPAAGAPRTRSTRRGWPAVTGLDATTSAVGSCTRQHFLDLD